MSQLRLLPKTIHHNIDLLPIRFLKIHDISSHPFSFNSLQYFNDINDPKITLKKNISDLFPQLDLLLVDIEDTTMGLCLFEVLINDVLL